MTMQRYRRNKRIFAALLALHSPLPAWAEEVDDLWLSVEGVQVPDKTSSVHLQRSGDAEPQSGEVSKTGESTSAKVPILALVPTSESSATETVPVIRRVPVTSVAGTTNGSDRWQLAPIRLWGDLAYDFRRTSVEGQSTFTRNSAVVNLNASTYIYEPWVALVSGGLGLSFSRLHDGELSGQDKFITGNARLNIFPASRFPFEARYLRSDSGTDTEQGVDQRFQLTRYGVTQRYRNDEGTQQYSASFDRFIQDGNTVGKDIQNALQFESNTKFRRDHDIQLQATLNHNQRVSTAERNDYETLMARHAYQPDSTLSLENSVNLTHTDFRLASAESDLRIFQLSSIAFWRPESQPLSVNSSVRVFSLESGTGKESTGTRAINASGGANYAFNRNFRAVGGLSLTDTSTSGAHNRTSIGTLGGNYQSDSIEFNKYRYEWFAGAMGISTNGAAERNGFSFNGIFGNSLSRGFDLGNGSAITFNLAQTLAALTGAQIEGSKQLFHSGSVTWNKSEPESGASSFVRLSATDSRYLDGQQETLQLVNLQLTRTLELGRDRAFSGNLTIQTTRRVSKRAGFEHSINEGRPETTVSADLNYRQQNIFGVPRLVFFSQLQVNRQELIQALGAPADRQLFSWENRLDYNIGRLELRLLLRFSELDGIKYSLVMFRATRRF